MHSPASPRVARLQVPELLEPVGLNMLVEGIERANADQELRAVVLHGRPGVFCRGMDLVVAANEPAGVAAMARCLRVLRSSSKPVLAAVDGQALGGGVGLAGACDYVVATERATFGLPELLLGLVPATIFPVLVQRMPAQQVRRLALLGHAHNAAEASRWGLVDEVVASTPESLERSVRRAIRRFGRGDAQAIALLKRLPLSACKCDDPNAAIELGAALLEDLLRSSVVQRKLSRFMEDEQAPWL